MSFYWAWAKKRIGVDFVFVLKQTLESEKHNERGEVYQQTLQATLALESHHCCLDSLNLAKAVVDGRGELYRKEEGTGADTEE